MRLLERFLTALPPELRVVLATREEPQLGLHRLRLMSRLIEIGASDLRFPLDEARELIDSSGVTLSDTGLASLCERTEGGPPASGLRRSRWPSTRTERFVAEFSGSERTVAGYLLAEVLERQPPEVRELPCAHPCWSG